MSLPDKTHGLATLAAVVIPVMRPFASTVTTGISAAEPYVPAVAPELSSRAPGTVPATSVPMVVMLAEPAHVESAVFSTALRPTLDLVSVNHAGSVYDPVVTTPLATVIEYAPEVILPE